MGTAEWMYTGVLPDPELVKGDRVLFTPPDDPDYIENGYLKAGVVTGFSGRDVLVIPDSDPTSEPIAVPYDDDWVKLDDKYAVPDPDVFPWDWPYYEVPLEERRKAVRETHGVALDPEFWAEHGIRPEVAEERGYDRWVIGHAKAPLEEAYAGIDLKEGQFRSFWTAANHANGIIITRYAPPAHKGYTYPRIFPEIRPDRPVPTRPPTKHYHGDKDYERALEAGRLVVEMHTGELLYPGDVGYDDAVKVAEKHIHRPEDMTNHTSQEKRHPNGNVQTVHYHKHEAKYIFAPSPIGWIKYTHAHKDMRWKKGENVPKNYEAHIEKHHSDHSDGYLEWCWDNKHTHWYEGKLKGFYYDEEGRRRGHDYARRIDVHPWAVEKIKKKERVFFGIEGCLKADAMLSAGAAVFSVPSVSLWEAPEHDSFIEDYLIGKQIIIVPDADWYKKWQVIPQARFCQTYLKVHGVEAHVATPPREAYEANPDIKGVDDFLGSKWGGSLDDLDVVDVEVDEDAMESVIEFKLRALVKGPRSPRSDRVERNVRVLAGLAQHAGSNGLLSVPLETLRRVVSGFGTGKFRRSRQRVREAILDLSDIGAITVEKNEVALRRDEIVEAFATLKENHWTHQYEWAGPVEERPLFRVDEKFRSKEQITRLGGL